MKQLQKQRLKWMQHSREEGLAGKYKAKGRENGEKPASDIKITKEV